MKPEQQVTPDDAELTVVLSPLLERDIEGIARWYDTATMLAGSRVPVGHLLDSTSARGEPVEPRAGTEALRLVVVGGDTQDPIGLMVVSLDDPGPAYATIALFAIATPEHRDLAALAVAMLEAYLQGEARHIRAAVPADVGLALYFWLRLGYHPIVSGERLWMTRELDP